MAATMNGGERFRAAWARASAGQDVSEGLTDLVSLVCREIDRRPTDLPALRDRLEALLAFLASPSGRTDPNCRAVDVFFCMPKDFGWTTDWEHLPEAVQEILADLGGALHDTIGAPEIARSCESTPEQLLDRVRRLNGEDGPRR